MYTHTEYMQDVPQLRGSPYNKPAHLCAILLVCSGSHVAELLSVELSSTTVVLGMSLLRGTAMLTEVGGLGGGEIHIRPVQSTCTRVDF